MSFPAINPSSFSANNIIPPMDPAVFKPASAPGLPGVPGPGNSPVDGYTLNGQAVEQFNNILSQLGMDPVAPGTIADKFGGSFAQQLSMIGAGLSANSIGASQAAFAAAIGSGPVIDYQDVNALVQQVLREAYGQNTEDLRMYAEKVKHFNAQKEMVRNHLGDLRKFETQAREFGISQGITDLSDPGSWSAEQIDAMQNFFATNSTNGVSSSAYTLAHNRSVDECVASAQALVQDAYGCELPDELESTLKEALESKDPSKIFNALTGVAGYLSYLGDASVANGQFGQGGGYDDVTHITAQPSFDDYQHYIQDPANEVARGNLHSGDVALIEEAFGVDLGIDGQSSVQEVVAAAMNPVNDKWAHEILHGRAMSSAEINQDLRANGPTSETALEIFGSAQAAVEAYWGGPIDAQDKDSQMRMELGMPNGVPGPGVCSIDQVSDEIKTWEDKLNSIGDDAQLANVDLQNMLQKQQQTLQMMSNISKQLNDTAMAIIRKMGG